MLDFQTLKVIWWLLLGILLIGFAIMDGFDLGAGMLLPFIGRSDTERRVVINTIGPVWEGNQVWLIPVSYTHLTASSGWRWTRMKLAPVTGQLLSPAWSVRMR